jgi:hypothetical protein
MAMGWLDICNWVDYWYGLCCSRFRRQLAQAANWHDIRYTFFG